jgi:hypothetical protein
MDEFSIRQGPWLNDIVGNDPSGATRARLGIVVAGTMLTHHEDIWTDRAADEVLVPHGVLAEWFVGSWWRLMCEPKPRHRGAFPDPDWRMAHEIGGAGGGCVWPFVGFATDLDAMWVFSDLLPDAGKQSVRYSRALERPAQVSLGDFQREVTRFVQRTVEQLEQRRCTSDLPAAWRGLCDEIANPSYTAWREVEARLGYDPGEGPDEQIEMALALKMQMGLKASAEILPAFGHAGINRIREILAGPGIRAKPPHLSLFGDGSSLATAPWRVGYATAKRLRQEGHGKDGCLETGRLSDWLGIRESDVEGPPCDGSRWPAAIAVAESDRGYTFHLRRCNSRDKRFELARLIGDFALTEGGSGEWLAATDLTTWRQQFQRAFAAELLCPAESLREFQDDLENDDYVAAADRFHVSEKVVSGQFANQLCD